MTRKEVMRHGQEERQGQGRQADVLTTVRPVAGHELDRFARQWASELDAETRHVESFGPFVQLGPRRGLGVRHRFMHHALIHVSDEYVRQSYFAVAEADGATLGWCAFDLPTDEHPLTIHFVCVEGLVRRRGHGSRLLSKVLAFSDERAPRYTCITSGGAALLRAVAALSDQTGAHGDRIDQVGGDGVVEAPGI